MSDELYETPAEADTSDLRAGKRITVTEAAVELAAIDLRLRQLARALETPETPVELDSLIESLRGHAGSHRGQAERMARLARIVDGGIPLAKHFPHRGEGWGAAARDSDREDFGGPAIIPTENQLDLLAREGARLVKKGEETTTFPEAMKGVGLGWESKAASARRRRERDAEVDKQVLRTKCETPTCQAGDGEPCRTKHGRISEQPHTGRLREAEATVDARLGYLGDNPVAVLDA
ncbi:hypothetical protein EV284_6440 [Streptomyces sp. BK022]|uniref:zinc finger domain-containing protein n=1 Tax=Streptomyces sp. BK022 TaxID=2512123 RepID=UPI0010295293|nr:hypothetical protein [Streptomyces sp. BK022]RZU28274.1 hypothetical protein EV284_6440 [Streptomyces sp. BK022]